MRSSGKAGKSEFVIEKIIEYGRSQKFMRFFVAVKRHIHDSPLTRGD
jgi:hypothetical protein